MRVTDSRDLGGVGILPLQDHTQGADVDTRFLVGAVRKTGRLDGDGELGHLIHERGTAGDILGGFIWKARGRAIPAWGFVFPARTHPASGATVTSAQPGGLGSIVSGGPGTAGGGDTGGMRIFEAPAPFGFAPGSLNGAFGNFGIAVPKGASANGSGASGAGGVTGSDSAGVEFGDSPAPSVLRPTIGSSWGLDTRFNAVQSPPPSGWPQMPGDWHGIMVAATNEERQIEYFHPTDPRLPVVHFDGDPRCSALACDLTAGGGADLSRHARLASMMRVVKGPKNAPEARNAVAWLIGIGGRKDVQGGYVFDTWRSDASKARVVAGKPTPGRTRTYTTTEVRVGGFNSSRSAGPAPGPAGLADVTHNWRAEGPQLRSKGVLQYESKASGKPHSVIAMASKNDRGPFDTGPSTDKHRITTDADGNAINPLHISTDALFRMDSVRDAPILWETFYDPDAAEYDAPTLVHLSYDGTTDRWRAWSTTVFEQEDIYHESETVTPRRPTTPPDRPRRPTITPGAFTGEGVVSHGIASGELGDPDEAVLGAEIAEEPGLMPPTGRARRNLASRREFMLPALAFRPNRIANGETDWRYFAGRTPRDWRKAHASVTPATLRFEAFGSQSKNGWNYTQQPLDGRHVGGTAGGGAVFLPPELDMAASLDSWSVPGVAASTSYVLAGPSVRWGAGKPYLQTGGLASGWSWALDGTELVFRSHDASGVATERLRLYQEGHLGLANRSGDPAALPSGGGFLYAKLGALVWKGSGGTVTEVAPA